LAAQDPAFPSSRVQINSANDPQMNARDKNSMTNLSGSPSATYEEVIEQFSKEVREYLCYREDGTLLISESHRFRPEVDGIIHRLKRLNLPCKIHMVNLTVIQDTWQRIGSTGLAEVVSDMQRAARSMWEKATEMRASDIHIRVADKKKSTIYFRIHGDLQFVEEHPAEWGKQLCTTMYQSMSDVSDTTFEPMSRQDARVSGRERLPEKLDGIRIATTPQVDGFIMVQRLLYNDTVESFDLGLIGFEQDHQIAIEVMKRRPTGVNIIAGPTGSGKSTTLQRTLGAIISESEGRKHVITVEDPPEYTIEGAVQTPVTNVGTEDERRAAFLEAIKTTMRLDPDAIMIGEIRDNPSAELAIQAAMTGHQVWTTLHANSALAIIDRLLALGVPIESLTDHAIITGLICQRLVKKLCTSCRIPITEVIGRYTEGQLKRLGQVTDISKVYVKGEGCDCCRKTGWIGRTAVVETIITDANLMKHIRERDRIAALRYWKEEQGGKTMLRQAITLVQRGEIDPFAAEVVVGPLNMEVIEADNRIEARELADTFREQTYRDQSHGN